MTEVKAEYRVEGQPIQADVLETHGYLIGEAEAGKLNPDYLSPGRLCDLVSDLAAEVRRLRGKVGVLQEALSNVCIENADCYDALNNCGIQGFYDQFDGPADAIRQMAARLVARPEAARKETHE